MNDFKALSPGESLEYGIGEWQGALKEGFDEVVLYAAQNWPVQFELSTHWRMTPRGVEECYYVLTRTR